MSLIARVALRQLWARKGLNAIAVLGVVLGVLVLIAINGIMKGFQQKFLDNIVRISPHVALLDKRLSAAPRLLARFRQEPIAARVAHEVPSDRQLRIARPTELVRQLERLPGVAAAAGSLAGSAVVAFGSKQYPVEMRGIEPKAQDRVTPISEYMLSGLYGRLSLGEAILLGSGVAKSLGAKPGDNITIGSPLGRTLHLKTVGIFEAGLRPVDNNRVYVLLRDAQTILGRADVTGRIELRLNNAEDATREAAQLEALLGYDAESWQETNQNFLGLFRQQNLIIGFVVGAILAVGGFGILVVQIMIVLQKTQDIAILRSVGFRRFDILSIFLFQGALIASLGALLGDGAGHVLLRFLSKLEIRQDALVKSDKFLIHDDPAFYAYGAAFALVVGLIASFIPAWRAAQIEPVDVLRGRSG